MSLTNCRFYEEKYPEIDSFVMVNVKQVWVPDAGWECGGDSRMLGGEVLTCNRGRSPRWVPT